MRRRRRTPQLFVTHPLHRREECEPVRVVAEPAIDVYGVLRDQRRGIRHGREAVDPARPDFLAHRGRNGDEVENAAG